MKERMVKLLAVLMVIAAACVVLEVVGHPPARGAVSTPTTRTEDPPGNPPAPPPFECQADCDCEVPKAGTVFCMADPQTCEGTTDLLDCLLKTFPPGGDGGAPGPAYVALNGGKKPSGCKSSETQTNCGEKNFECYYMGYCGFSTTDNCITVGPFGGPAQQVAKKVSVGCGLVNNTPVETPIADEN